MARPQKQKAGWFGFWECVTCGARTKAPPLGIATGWLCYRAGRLCRSCALRFEVLPVGSYVDLGNGFRLVKIG